MQFELEIDCFGRALVDARNNVVERGGQRRRKRLENGGRNLFRRQARSGGT